MSCTIGKEEDAEKSQISIKDIQNYRLLLALPKINRGIKA